MVTRLNWIKPEDGRHGFNLMTLDVAGQHFDDMVGIYVIWHGGSYPWTVRVGQGVVRDRLGKHRIDPDILKYKDLGLNVSWVKVGSQDERDNIEAYLANVLDPKVGKRFPDKSGKPVNAPWN
ncbi:MAG: hypothetical protein HYT65_03280 [Candidatus Yanofskybacteria bacterium]|nr:hypothetical protein [Candidatus Yanofskybacteria bacterium]